MAYCVCASRVPDERVMLLLLVGVSVSLYLPYKFSLKWWINWAPRQVKKKNMLPFITPKCLGLLCVWVCCSVKVRVSGLWRCRSFHMIYVCCWKVLLLTTEALPSFIYWWRRSLTLWCVNLNAWRHFFCTIIKVLWQAATVSSLICTITVYFRVFNGMIFNKSFLFGDIFENII